MGRWSGIVSIAVFDFQDWLAVSIGTESTADTGDMGESVEHLRSFAGLDQSKPVFADIRSGHGNKEWREAVCLLFALQADLFIKQPGAFESLEAENS